MKEGGGEGKVPSFLPLLFPALLLAPFFARSLILVPRSLLQNCTETLAAQAIGMVIRLLNKFQDPVVRTPVALTWS